MSAISSAFSLLHPDIQRWVWEQRWEELRDAQEEAIPQILRGENDVLLAAATAMGKTEAAFLPILTRLCETRDDETPLSGIEALYISPLKALINDQFRRLDLLCDRLEIPVHRWHGDVGQQRKQQVLKKPSGVLLMTPESLEALFVRRGVSVLLPFFRGLRYVVIDELHTFIGEERGRQLQSLLHRLESLVATDRFLPRIGLSATLSDLRLAATFLRPHAPEQVVPIVSRTATQEIRAQIRGYVEVVPNITLLPSEEDEDDGTRRIPKAGTPSYACVRQLWVSCEPLPSSEIPDFLEPEAIDPDESTAGESIADHLFQHLRTGHHLVFTNRREEVEIYTDRLARRSSAAHLPNVFFPHHGSLSKEIREYTEERLKDPLQPATALCTSTLEMGIDIGAMETIAQIGVPPSVASLRQRVGRSGRRGDPCRVRLYIAEEEILPQTRLPDLLRWRTVQATVMLQLMVTGWCEPPAPQTMHLSTFIQQILSVIAQQGGGASATLLYRLLCTTGPFSTISKAQFIELLQTLHKKEVVAQMDDGTLIQGPVGERIASHYSFYTAFATPEEYRLVPPDGKQLGTLPVDFPIPPGTYLIYAGKRWKVEAVDDIRRIVDVVPAKGGKAPRFSGGGGWTDDLVRETMWAFYRSTEVPAFLDANARTFVAEGRKNFQRFGLENNWLREDGTEVRCFLWAGDRVQETLRLELLRRGLTAENEDICLRIEADGRTVQDVLQQIATTPPVDPLVLAGSVPNTILEKHDHLLPESLRAAEYAARYLRPAEMQQRLQTLFQLGESRTPTLSPPTRPLTSHHPHSHACVR